MVSASAGPELSPSAVLVLHGDRTHAPILVQHIVDASGFESRPHAELRLGLDRLSKTLTPLLKPLNGEVEDRHLHPAGDIHADRIGNHRVVGGEHAANREPVAYMRIGHQRSRHGHWQVARQFDLPQSQRIDIASPLMPRRGWPVGTVEVGLQKCVRKGATNSVVHMRLGIRQHSGNLLRQPIRSSALLEEALNQFKNLGHGIAPRDAELDEFFGFH